MAFKPRSRAGSLRGGAPVQERTVPPAQLRSSGIGAVEEFEDGCARVLGAPDGVVVEQVLVQGFVPRGCGGTNGSRLNPRRLGVGEGVEGRARVCLAAGPVRQREIPAPGL